MTEWIILIGWVIGFLLSSRWVISWFYHDEFGGDGEGIFLGLAVSICMLSWGWPLFALVRGVYVAWMKYGPSEVKGFWDMVFPENKKIETRYEREKRLRKQAELELQQYQIYARREGELVKEER